jgi:hypothetical protein
MIGQKFGFLTVFEIMPGTHVKKPKARCICDCGNETIVFTEHLRSGNTKSCGCWRKAACLTHGHTRGQQKSATYRSWQCMIDRCTNNNYPRWEDYGGRGIGIEDPRWLQFENFLSDMGERPSGKTLDRYENDRGYCKANCRWATRSEQQSNKRPNKQPRKRDAHGRLLPSSKVNRSSSPSILD